MFKIWKDFMTENHPLVVISITTTQHGIYLFIFSFQKFTQSFLQMFIYYI